MPRRAPADVDTFARVLLDVHFTGLSMTHLADRFGVSPKTITRYIHGYAVPPASRRHGIVHALHDIDPALLRRVISSLDLSHAFGSGLPRRAVDANVARPLTEAAFEELMDGLDARRVSGRQHVLQFLARLAAANVDAATAHALLRR